MPAAFMTAATAARPSAAAASTSRRSTPAAASDARSRSSLGVTARMIPGPAVSQAAAYRALNGVVALALNARVAPTMDLCSEREEEERVVCVCVCVCVCVRGCCP